MVLSTGLGAVPPSAQSDQPFTTSEISSSSSMSPSRPSPAQILLSTLSIWHIPSRQGAHLPQDSSDRKFRKYLAVSTMQVSSSITIMPPDPIIEPALASSSKSTGRSRNFSGITPPEGPPV